MVEMIMGSQTVECIYTVSLSLAEYGLIAAYVGLEGLLGVPDPFEGMDADQQTAALEAASATLQERGLLVVDEAGQSVELDAITAALVKAAGLAERIISLSVKTEDDYTQRLIFVGPELIVEQQEADGQLNLTAVRDADILASRTAKFLACAYQGGPVGEAVSLRLEDLAEAQRLASEPEACLQALVAGGVAEDAARPLADALCGPHQLGILSVFRVDQEGDAEQSLAFLAAPAASWLMVHGIADQDCVVARPVSVGEIEAQVHELATSLLGLPSV